VQLNQTSRVQHTTRARLLRRPQHVGRVSPNRPRRTIRQLHHEQQYAVPSLERLRREQPPEQRMRPGDDSDLTRQNRTKMLQSVALTAGTGKSHLLVALGVAAVHAGHRVRYFTAADLVDTLYRGLADNSVGRVIDTLLRNDLIILDELGFAPLDDTGAQLLFRFIAAAYERRSLGIGSHWPFESWGRFLPEHTTAVSLLDRLLHHCHTVVTDGDSFRMKQARAGTGTTARTTR
jgi:hypothetical protein